MRTLILFILALLATSETGHAQNGPPDYLLRLDAQMIEIEQQRAEAITRLRQAIQDLRQANLRSCQFKPGVDCHLAELGSAELIFLNIEDSYRKAEIKTMTDKKREYYKKVKETTDEL